jgi:hypothetical protein
LDHLSKQACADTRGRHADAHLAAFLFVVTGTESKDRPSIVDAIHVRSLSRLLGHGEGDEIES